MTGLAAGFALAGWESHVNGLAAGPALAGGEPAR
jgi:hypothetical protein